MLEFPGATRVGVMAAEQKKIVLLYNDRDIKAVREVHGHLEESLKGTQHGTWIADRDLTAFGSLFQQILGAIRDSPGVVIFHGDSGLGRFQENIELEEVHSKLWRHGEGFGVLVVHLPGSTVATPEGLSRFPSVNHRHELNELAVNF